jgi:uncharacterized protein (TIGR00725 family)
MSKIVVGVMGPGGEASDAALLGAFQLGRLIALEGWILLTGGRSAGVMDAASRGAKDAGGITVGILPTSDTRSLSEAVDIPIITGMGQARNNINVLSSRVVFACGMGAGTASEVALTLKARKPVILLYCGAEAEAFFKSLDSDNVFVAADPEEAVALAKKLIGD